MCSIIAFAMVAFALSAHAAVTARPTAANNAAAARAQNRTTARVPTTNVSTSVATTPEIEPEPEEIAAPDPEPEVPIIVDNKTSMFEDVISELGALESDMSNDERAAAIRRQRALLDTPYEESTAGTANMGRAGACDAELRKCMMEKCGNDFTKCANDSTTIWGQKIELCRAKTECTAHDYALIAPEILADRDINVRMQHYDSVINCGNRYNNCIFTQCGTTLNKCLAKKDGDNAISKCATIANECKSMDNGLAARAMTVFGDLRKIATAQVQKDEARLYELRDLIRNQCNRFGAMFDERTLDCVYTVNFFAGEDRTLMASKKLYSGDTFQCNANWFGIDITTYIENAQRLTRSQTSASAAALGAGIGTAAGLVSSGATGRAIKTQNAEKAVKAAQNEKQCSTAGGTWSGKKCIDANGNEMKFDENGNVVNNNNRQTGMNAPELQQNTPKQTETPEQTNDETEQRTGFGERTRNYISRKVDTISGRNQEIEIQAKGLTPDQNFPEVAPTLGQQYEISDEKLPEDAYDEPIQTEPEIRTPVQPTVTTTNTPNNTPTTKLDSSVNGTGAFYWNFSAQNKDGDSDKAKNRGDWGVEFNGYTVTGISTCSTSQGNLNNLKKVNQKAVENSYTSQSGKWCYCKMTSPNESNWIFQYEHENAPKCKEQCAGFCAVAVRFDSDFRKILYSTNK